MKKFLKKILSVNESNYCVYVGLILTVLTIIIKNIYW